jgi:energy-coupling factor transporter transmembrane protein EcfT
MAKAIFFIAVVLLIVLIITLIVIGLCIGIAHLMIYFIQTIDLVDVLIPSAILTTALIFVFGSVFIAWFKADWDRVLNIHEEADEDGHDSLTVTRIHPYRNNRHRR